MPQKKTLGEIDGPGAFQLNNNEINNSGSNLQLSAKFVLSARNDGLVREEKENRFVSRDDTTEVKEVEDFTTRGDFTDAVSLYLFLYQQNVVKVSFSKFY